MLDLVVAELPAVEVQEFSPVTIAITNLPLADSGTVRVLVKAPSICSQPAGTELTAAVTALSQRYQAKL